jgi:hypothetical protein
MQKSREAVLKTKAWRITEFKGHSLVWTGSAQAAISWEVYTQFSTQYSSFRIPSDR